MNVPKASVIIPAYNQARFIGEAIQSVIDQTYQNWELIVVDDGSTDSTPEEIARYKDPRIQCIRQPNQGLPAARNTGLRSARGEYLAFLDSDDLFHVRKLALQADHLDRCPEIGLSYGSRIEIDQDGKPMWLLIAPPKVSLPDLLQSFPFTINDILVRRSWVEKVHGFDASYRLHGEDRVFYLQLALQGCSFGCAERVVAFRRLHARRQFTKIPERIETMERALEVAFNHPHCPKEGFEVRNSAYGNIYLAWACQEFVQEDTLAAQEHLRKAIQYLPSILENQGRKFLDYLGWFGIRDGGEHEAVLRMIFAQLPADLSWLAAHTERVIALGYLKRGASAICWEQLAAGDRCLKSASGFKHQIDQASLRSIIDLLIKYEAEFGSIKGKAAFQRVLAHLRAVDLDADLSWMVSTYYFNQALTCFHQAEYRKVPLMLLKTVTYHPKYLLNRGVISMFFKSLLFLPAVHRKNREYIAQRG